MTSLTLRKVDEAQQIGKDLDDDGFSAIRRRFEELNIPEPNIDAELAAMKKQNRRKKQTNQLKDKLRQRGAQGDGLPLDHRLQRHRGRGARAAVAPMRALLFSPLPLPTHSCPCAQNHWVRPALDFDTNTVVDLFDQWGWLVTLYDGLDE